MKACRGSHKQEFQKLWRWRCSKAWPHLPNEVLRQAKVCLPVVTRPWPFLKHYMVYVKIRFKLRNLSVSSSSPPFVFSQTYSYSHDVHLSCHIKIIAKCAGEEEEQLLQVIFWKTPYMIVLLGNGICEFTVNGSVLKFVMAILSRPMSEVCQLSAGTYVPQEVELIA